MRNKHPPWPITAVEVLFVFMIYIDALYHTNAFVSLLVVVSCLGEQKSVPSLKISMVESDADRVGCVTLGYSFAYSTFSNLFQTVTGREIDDSSFPFRPSTHPTRPPETIDDDNENECYHKVSFP
jgi:hypothetical protein